MARGLHASVGRLGVEIERSGRDLKEVESILADVGAALPPSIDELLAKATNLGRQKWDSLLSPHLLRETYASSNLALDEAILWLKSEMTFPPNRGSNHDRRDHIVVSG